MITIYTADVMPVTQTRNYISGIILVVTAGKTVVASNHREGVPGGP